MLNEHFIPFDVLSHTKIQLMLICLLLLLLFLEKNMTVRLSQKILIGLAIELTILTPPTKFLNHSACVAAL
jgi:hypothetical protein